MIKNFQSLFGVLLTIRLQSEASLGIKNEHKWILGVKNIMINCGIPMVDTYINFVSDSEFKKDIQRQREDLATQS